jgi:hypothetical protein
MTQLTEFSSPIIKGVFRHEFAEFIKEFGEKYGVEFEFPSTISYDTTEFNLRLKVKIAGAEAKTRRSAFSIPTMIVNEVTGHVEAPPANGTKFKVRGETFEVTGYKANRPKFPVQATSLATNRRYKFTLAQVKSSKI